MKGNQVFGPGTLSIDIYNIPEDEYLVLCDAIKHEADRQVVAHAMSPENMRQIRSLGRSLPRGAKVSVQ